MRCACAWLAPPNIAASPLAVGGPVGFPARTSKARYQPTSSSHSPAMPARACVAMRVTSAPS